MATAKLVQVIYLSQADYTAFLKTQCLPRDGAFSSKESIDVGQSVEELREFLLDNLHKQEDYHSSYWSWMSGRKVPKRSFMIRDIHRHPKRLFVIVEFTARWIEPR